MSIIRNATAKDNHIDGNLDGRLWEPGEQAHFEYHCERGHDSADAELWYHDHQTVTIVGVREDCDGWREYQQGYGARDRIDNGMSIAYKVRFEDGMEWTVLEDELYVSPEFFDPRLGPPPQDEIARYRQGGDEACAESDPPSP